VTQFAAPLTERQVQILLAVVREHVRTREPVGSQVVREVCGMKASTATIRNEMVELEQAGYLYQPHTSAGRVPCDSAYRLYVNYLSAGEPPEPGTPGWIEGEYRRLGTEPHELLRQTSRLLARLTSHPAVVTLPPADEPGILGVRLQPVSGTNVLLVYATADGRERHHVLTLPEPVTAAQLTALGAALERVAVGRPAGVLSRLTAPMVRPYLGEQSVPDSVLASISQAAAADDTTAVYVEGASYILDEPEFEERERLRAFMRSLDEESSLRRVLQAAIESPDMTVTIGHEHDVTAMQGCSLVASSYPYGKSRGAVGIFGPTRMDYRRAMGTVAFVARKLAEALGHLRR
jgi:heat-inducible transcriptional repressor